MSELVEACLNGDADKFQRLFSKVDKFERVLEKQDKLGKRLIHYAAEGGSKEIVTAILDEGGLHQVALETSYESDCPINIALMSDKPGSSNVAMLLMEKMNEIEAVPRKNRLGNHPLHYAAKKGDIQLLEMLANSFPETVYAPNGKGNTPISFASWEGNLEAVKTLLQQTPGPPTKFSDFKKLFPSSTCLEKELDPPINVFVLGDNQCGKSSVIKSLQADSFYDRLWGLTWNTSNVNNHKIGLIPNDFISRSFGRIILHDLASGPNFLNMQLVSSREDISSSIFIIVIDCRPEKRDMEKKMEFWLNVVLQQCSGISDADPSFPKLRPNVMILGSFGELVKVFRHNNSIRIDLTFRNITKRNPDLIGSFNILAREALDCRKAQSPPMGVIRYALKQHCKVCHRRGPEPEAIDASCYLLSSVFSIKSMEDKAPVMSIKELSNELLEKSSLTDNKLSMECLIPSEVSELVKLCKVLEDRKRVLLVTGDTHAISEETVIVFDIQKLAGFIDTALLKRRSEQAQPSNPQVALIQKDSLQSFLSDSLSVRADIVVPILDAIKIHLLEQNMSLLPIDQPHYFIPALLPEENPDTEEWEESVFCFACTYKPSHNDLNRHFLPTYTNTLLIALFDVCASMDKVTFDHHLLWQGGIRFRQHNEVEIVVNISSGCVTLNIRYQANYEIVCLDLRNRLLEKIRLLKKAIQPALKVDEFIIPRDGARFPVYSPTPSKSGVPLEEVKQLISKSTVSLTRLDSVLSLNRSTASQTTQLSNEADQFFEPCHYIARLDTNHQQYLIREEHADKELSENFLIELKRCLGESYYRLIEEYFNLPPIYITPASSVCGDSVSGAPSSPRPGTHARTSSITFNYGMTYGELVGLFDSISIFNTREFLVKVQGAGISSGTPSNRSNSMVSIDSSSSSARSRPAGLLSTRQIFTHTTIPTDMYSNIYFVDQIQEFRCSKEGGLFHSTTNGISITFPRGAVPETSPPINIQFGVALNGPFEFPDNHRPISPFMWFCTEDPDFVFQKPVEIVLPHYVNAGSSECEKLTFMKADHRLENDQEYQFKECSEKMRFRSHSNHGVLYTTHTCFMCIVMKTPATVISKATYCLVKAVPKTMSKVFNIFFCVTFFLETCMTTVERQFNSEDYEIQRSLITLDTSSPEPVVSIEFQQQLEHNWTVTADGGSNEIPASDIEFWHHDIGRLHMLDKHNMYPPRFTLKVCGSEAKQNSILNVKFGGLKRPISFQVQLLLPDPPKLRTLRSRPSITDSPVHPVQHPLDSIIMTLVDYLDVDVIRLPLRQKGTLKDSDMKYLLDVAIKGLARSVQVEALVDNIKRKGDEGMSDFIEALQATTDGTGHRTIIEALLPTAELSSL